MLRNKRLTIKAKLHSSQFYFRKIYSTWRIQILQNSAFIHWW